LRRAVRAKTIWGVRTTAAKGLGGKGKWEMHRRERTKGIGLVSKRRRGTAVGRKENGERLCVERSNGEWLPGGKSFWAKGKRGTAFENGALGGTLGGAVGGTVTGTFGGVLGGALSGALGGALWRFKWRLRWSTAQRPRWRLRRRFKCRLTCSLRWHLKRHPQWGKRTNCLYLASIPKKAPFAKAPSQSLRRNPLTSQKQPRGGSGGWAGFSS
jgi:hypothetical protein